jgi:hypothetical protein
MENEDIEALIRIYTDSARNLRNVAAIADAENNDSPVSRISLAKAQTYELVIDDLQGLLAGNERAY